MEIMKENCYLKHLNVWIEYEWFRINLNEEPVKGITHRSLEDILFNQLPAVARQKKMQISYEIKKIFCSDSMAGFACIITDSSGRKIVEVGEARKEDAVDTQLIKTAKDRAMDNALIKYLKFSDNFIAESDLKRSDRSLKEQTRRPPNTEANGENSTMPSEPSGKWDNMILQFGQYKGYHIEDIYSRKDGRRWLKNALIRLYKGEMNSVEGKAQYNDIYQFLKEKGEIK